jgi:EAL domain-containing protein (putative c-di-GMP-specific phosphodiesterase class I)
MAQLTTRAAANDSAAIQRAFIQIIDKQRVRSVYQPIIDLESGDIAAFEALARGPAGSPLESPNMLFGTGRRLGLLNELEWACRAAALQGALDANLGTQLSLFINVEPSVVGGVIPANVEALFRKAERKLRIVLELTERDLTRRPADLLRLVSWARDRYWGVALDDVGAEPESLALLPFVEPDVVKLDMKLIQEEMTPDEEAVVDAVQRYARRTGASVLAEGIETEEHKEKSLRLGANLGQGWLFGRPASLDGILATRAAVRLLPPPPRPEGGSAFEILEENYEAERVSRGQLLEQTSKLEQLALEQEPAPVVLASFGSAGRFVPRADDYVNLADRCTLVGVLGTGSQGVPESKVRYTVLDERDPLAREWIVAVVGPGMAEVVAARSLGRDPDSVGDEVEFIRSDDRDTVMAVAQLLMSRVVPKVGRVSA